MQSITVGLVQHGQILLHSSFTLASLPFLSLFAILFKFVSQYRGAASAGHKLAGTALVGAQPPARQRLWPILSDNDRFLFSSTSVRRGLR